jgi:MoaA/NifB/PqqE/SkfB family radical SAM enzyme
MTAPLFTEFLDELSQARGGQPTVVHLLTNGQAMTEVRFLDAVERGVNSISFSVDGMSAATHDRLRVLSHAGKLLPRIESLARLRREKAMDVRLGLAWTVTRNNAAELPQLIEFVARTGLDWVKLEEVYPIHDVARAEMLDEEPLRAAVATALDHAARLHVKLLDHTREQPVWKCRLHLDGGMARFSELDDFANRMHINPCALPYQLCCIEPNGDVKPMSFHHPVAGNLLQADLRDIFNSGRFSVVRKQALAARLCGRERPSCAVDPGPASW